MGSGGFVCCTKRGRAARVASFGLTFARLPVANVDINNRNANAAQRRKCGVSAGKAAWLCAALRHQEALCLGLQMNLDGERAAIARKLNRAHAAVDVQKFELVQSQGLHGIAAMR